ncbi:Di-copper centre-containing protein [Patellaria atrata CBS 101060]|uniref:Di-copper centre-containing protein n=1 Tax=Patellaria atrata CBS 101060 TaxID=1346257 RepID=A0A9P4VWI8_9PEZI|nr:Di-copper centre-containing protein [Patellaria atrata CBS 101060]
MSYIAVTAFGPIFWLHHSNVDRLFTIWLALYPLTTDQPQHWFEDPTRAQKALKPFHKSLESDGFWTSDDTRETGNLGYTYPDVPKKLQIQDGRRTFISVRTQEELIRDLNGLYGSTRHGVQKAHQKPVASRVLKLADAFQRREEVRIQAQITNADPLPEVIHEKVYIALIKYEIFDLRGEPFSVDLFIGKVPETNTPHDALEFKTLVERVYFFVTLVEIEDVAETPQFHRNQELRSLDPEDIAPFLKDNLHWRIVTTDGILRKEDVPSLKVAVAVGEATHFADSTKLSIYEKYKILYEITDNRLAGAQPEDHLLDGSDLYDNA